MNNEMKCPKFSFFALITGYQFAGSTVVVYYLVRLDGQFFGVLSKYFSGKER